MRARSLFALLTPAMLLVGVTGLATPAAAGPAARVDVCHVPPGNPENLHTITVSENALPAHLGHGDFLGSCEEPCETRCDDSNACTIDDCDAAGQCIHAPVDCNDSNSCTADSCDPVDGCKATPLEGDTCTVNDTDPCTEPTGMCNASGICASTPVPGCCNTDAECDAVDEDRCTIEACIGNTCQTVGEVNCSIDECNVSVCVPATGGCTVPEPRVCDELECHDNGCDPQTGCFSNPIEGCCIDASECNDNNNCTTDTCLGVAGCQNVSCATGDACNILLDCEPDTCAPITEPPICDDTNSCTDDSCDAAVGCLNIPVSCPEGDTCNLDTGVCEAPTGDCLWAGTSPTPNDLLRCSLENFGCPAGTVCDINALNDCLFNPELCVCSLICSQGGS